TGAQAQFQSPLGLVTDLSGIVLFVTDVRTIREVRTSDGQTSTLPIQGTALSSPTFRGLTFDGAGSLLATGSSNSSATNQIMRIPVAVGDAMVVTGVSGFEYREGDPRTAVFGLLMGIARDSNGNLYVGDFGFERVRVVDGSGMSNLVAG